MAKKVPFGEMPPNFQIVGLVHQSVQSQIIKREDKPAFFSASALPKHPSPD